MSAVTSPARILRRTASAAFARLLAGTGAAQQENAAEAPTKLAAKAGLS
ncbi:hypothetical protein HC022_14905 [Salipiger sp. HF18]|nr:hypothetical protein [Salipiger sp. HF18]NIY97486.1 hypothetical protein [Salipiger sp. HF18]